MREGRWRSEDSVWHGSFFRTCAMVSLVYCRLSYMESRLVDVCVVTM